MRPIYATRFRLEQRGMPEGTPADFDTVLAYVRRWIEGKYRGRQHGLTNFSMHIDGRESRPVAGNELFARDQPIGGGRLFELRHIEADSEEPGRQWRTDITLASDGQRLEFSLLLRVGSSTFIVQPHGRIQTGPPRVVRKLISDFVCKAARVEIASRDTVVMPGETEMLVDRILLDSKRALPVVLVSQLETDETVHPTSDIRAKLVGLAHVYEINYEAGYELTRLVGKASSCFHGAVRLYWPGFKQDEAKRHPLFTTERMEELVERHATFEDHLFRRLSEVAAARFVDSPVVRTLRQIEERTRREEVQKLRHVVRDAQNNPAKADDAEWLAELDKALTHNETLSARIEELEEQNLELQYELETAKQNIVAVQNHAGRSSQQDDIEEVTETPPSSIGEVLNLAARRFEAYLDLSDSAHKAAEASSSSRVDDVARALEDLKELSKRYFSSPDRSVGPWDDYFRERGLNYARAESEQTMAMHGDERIFRHNGTQWTMEKHLTIAKNHPTDCVQIYFDVDEENGRFVIGYCGPHLKTATSTF